MASRCLCRPLRIVAGQRPAIQAWRSARCFATEVAAPTTTAPIPADISNTTTAPIPREETLRIAPSEDATTATTTSPATGRAVGVVVSAGKMSKTVKVRLPGQKWNKYLKKHFKDHSDHLVHDPNESLQIGDVVALRPHRTAKNVHHVVSEILVPFGTPIAHRPAVPTEEESRAAYEEKRRAKEERQSLRRASAQGSVEAIAKLKAMGITLDQGVQAGVGEKKAKKAGLVGKKGQKLPEGVLPGGKHAVGKIHDRTQVNKEKAVKRTEQAANNSQKAREFAEKAEA